MISSSHSISTMILSLHSISIFCLQSLLFLTTNVVHVNVNAARQDLIAIIQRLNSDLLELRNEIEKSISKRCASIAACSKSSYDECQSEYTESQMCPAFEKYGYAIPECGSGQSCNGLFDHTISTVRLPSNLATGHNGNPTDPNVVEAVCYTQIAQDWMVNKYNQDMKFWQGIGVGSPQMFFGSSTGVFRIFPARQSRECGVYDPRLRPWYQATVPSVIGNSVKPRNVIILMDTSRSMNDTINTITGETKLSFVKHAAVSTISALSEKASVAVIQFGEVASIIGQQDDEVSLNSSSPLWQKVTDEHKEQLIDEINAIDVSGRSNWIAGYRYAFDLIKNSLLRQSEGTEETYACELENIALLFFSDGSYNLPGGFIDEQVINFVSSNVKEVEAMGDYHLHTFLYSVGNTDTNQIMKQMACEVDGYWTPVSGKMPPGNVTNGYQALFSTPMGTLAFYNYTSWSAPYNFTSSGKLGYTISGLVYNREVEPPLFMGAVGMDISAEAARQLYGGTLEETVQAMNEIIDEIKETKFNATCDQQRINLTYCEVQSLRQLAGGNEAVCELPETNATNQNVTGDDATLDAFSNCSKGFLTNCPGYDEYPSELWQNVNLQGKSYHDRVCCEVGTNNVSSNCPELDVVRDTKLSDAAIFGIVFAFLVVVEILCCYFCFYHKKKRST